MKIRIKMVFYLILLSPLTLYASPSSINAKGAVLVEEESMRILWERDSDQPLPMASTTKIMTCLLALEEGNKSDIVVASKRAAAAPKVKMYLVPGERQTLGDLLYALMLESSNDAAVAIAEHIGGSVEGFCLMMTQRAQELGTQATCFKTPNGLDAPGHMSSPYDLALITRHAYQNPEFLEIIRTPSKNIPSAPLEGSRPHHFQNKNRLLTSYTGANGVKTGYTGLAGHCFVGGAKQGDMQLFAVVLASGWGPSGNKKKYSDTMSLFKYGFENYQMVAINQAMESVGSLMVKRGESDFVGLAYGQSLKLPLTQEEAGHISIKLKLPLEATAPIGAGQEVGVAHIYTGHHLLMRVPIITTARVDKRTMKSSSKKAFYRWTKLLYD